VFCKEVIEKGGRLYIVIKKIRIEHNPIVQTWREHLRADIVLKKEPFYYFCEEIVDVEPLEET
jgi:hypothetical protein